LHTAWLPAIYFEQTANNQISGCLVKGCNSGIILTSSYLNILRNNTICDGYENFCVGSPYLSNYENDIDTSNTIDGKPIYYMVGETDLVFDETMDIGYLSLYKCSNITVKNIELSDNCYGILFADTDNSIIENCNFDNNDLIGIFLIKAKDNIIRNCTASNSTYVGVLLEQESYRNTLKNVTTYDIEWWAGIELFNSNNNTIIGCECYGNIPMGLRLFTSDYNTVSDCYIHDNTKWGIVVVVTSSNNEIHNCLIDGNPLEGIYIYEGSDPPSVSNLFYHNNLLNNDPNGWDDCTNQWDNGYPLGGNFWSDYTGEDNYSGENQTEPKPDRIGDTPYNISGNNNQDQYPLMAPTKNVRPNEPETPQGTESGKAGENYSYRTSTID